MTTLEQHAEDENNRIRAARRILDDRVENDFTLHPPANQGALDAMNAIRSVMKETALVVVNTCPLGREQSTALTKLEEATFHAIASIARNQSAFG